MIVVIIAGGSGSRLWPLSTPNYPKHLMKLSGDSQSLLQSTYERARQLTEKIYVVSDASHAEHVKGQLPELTNETILVEPARRGTANCVTAALVRLEKQNVNHTEPIIFMHADHYIRDINGFSHSFKIASHVSRQENRIVLIGIEPDYPATGFGYICKDRIFNDDLLVYEVKSFTEKPAFNIAQRYVKSGNYLWNCGYFVGSLETFKRDMQAHSSGMHRAYDKLLRATTPVAYQKAYLELEEEVIDRSLIEKIDNLLVVPASFDWMDIGSYVDLHKAVESDELGNHVQGERIELDGVENAFIHNHEDKPLGVVGLDNIVVINSKYGVLVARKDLSKKIGDISKRISSKY